MAEFREQVWQKSISCPDRNEVSHGIEIERGPDINSESEWQRSKTEPDRKAWK